MAESNPPDFLGAECYTFADFRQTFGGVVCEEGVTESGDLLVTAAGGGSLNVNVAAGTAWVKGDLNGAAGMYFITNNASVAVTIGANGAGSSRTDLVIASVYDSQYIGGADAWAIEVVQGVAGAGTPAVPTSTRAGYLVLGQVTVPASGGTPSVVAVTANLMRTCGTPVGPPPYVELVSTGTTSCANNTLTKLALASTVHVDAAFFIVSASLVQVQQDGLYHMQGNAGFNGLAAGSFEVNLMKNGLGGTKVSYHYGGSTLGYYGASPVGLFVPLSSGNTIQVGVKQVTGGTANCDGGGLKVWKVG